MNFWLKLRVWTKIVLFSMVAIYLLVFLFKNVGADKQVTLWYWFGYASTMPVLLFMTTAFLFGVITTLLVRTILRTVGQMRELKRKRMEKEAAAIVARASKLRVRETLVEKATGESLPQ
jgi:uncharacterized integral membrane protein